MQFIDSLVNMNQLMLMLLQSKVYFIFYSVVFLQYMKTYCNGPFVYAVIPRLNIAVPSNKTLVLCHYFVGKRCIYEVKGKITSIFHAFVWEYLLDRTLTLGCLLGEVWWQDPPFTATPSQLFRQFPTRCCISTTRPFAQYSTALSVWQFFHCVLGFKAKYVCLFCYYRRNKLS